MEGIEKIEKRGRHDGLRNGMRIDGRGTKEWKYRIEAKLFECEKRVAHVRNLCESQFVVANHHLLELVLVLQRLLSKVCQFLSGHSILFEAADIR